MRLGRSALEIRAIQKSPFPGHTGKRGFSQPVLLSVKMFHAPGCIFRIHHGAALYFPCLIVQKGDGKVGFFRYYKIIRQKWSHIFRSAVRISRLLPFRLPAYP